jgi:hypothetical protein
MIHDMMQKDKNYLAALSAPHGVWLRVVELLMSGDVDRIRRSTGMH